MISKYLGFDSDYIIIGLCGVLLILFILTIVNIVQMKKLKELPHFYEWKRCKDTGRYIDSKVRSG